MKTHILSLTNAIIMAMNQELFSSFGEEMHIVELYQDLMNKTLRRCFTYIFHFT